MSLYDDQDHNPPTPAVVASMRDLAEREEAAARLRRAHAAGIDPAVWIMSTDAELDALIAEAEREAQ
ncbi:hypothetical protein Lfu02_15180 [Longispora fulva]|uniref:Uncharacterized protein n=1 Tax=Longispora fulva TaxID=619741 RepID=A0A8J7KT92_9ACTN|nr:hypothetical protein [Longispora fulva]MBG6140472.1 hypothetical protein [Longispora fulva]GIG57146.1 hypothetical protein Lfu02_15180 [Longispora fulva]